MRVRVPGSNRFLFHLVALLFIGLWALAPALAAGADRDGDGVLDAVDNCPEVANEAQANRDSDALGDACDPYPDQDLRVRVEAPGRARIQEPAEVIYRLEDPEGNLLDELQGVQATLTVDGAARFGDPSEGHLLAGWGTGRALVEFVEGRVTIEISDTVPEFVTLGLEDSEAMGIAMESDIFENFEGSTGGFVTEGRTDAWQHGVPTSGPRRAYSGQSVWGTVLDGNYPADADDWLISPAIALPPGNFAQLEYQGWFDCEVFYDRGYVDISLDQGQSWINLRYLSGDKGGYTHHVIDLAEYAGRVIRVRFRFKSDLFFEKEGWYIDDFAVRGINVSIRFTDSLNTPPVANAGPDQEIECERRLKAKAHLDGSASYDEDSTPGTQDNIVSYLWSVEERNIGTRPIIDHQFAFGRHQVQLKVTDRDGEFDIDNTIVEVVDTAAPEGSISFPEEGRCFGEEEVPVVVESRFEDTCDPEPALTYTPAGGPAYQEHGDLHVTVRASDRGGNEGTAEIFFTIDLQPPSVTVIAPPQRSVSWEQMPAELIFESHDDDGATGGPIHETAYLDDCLLYDGWEFGDKDGLLSDEVLELGDAALCRALERCGREFWTDPVIRIFADDCGGNLGQGIRRVPGSFRAAREKCSD